MIVCQLPWRQSPADQRRPAAESGTLPACNPRLVDGIYSNIGLTDKLIVFNIQLKSILISWRCVLRSFRTLSLTLIACLTSWSAMAVPVAAPGPEIGDGMIGAIVAVVALMVVVLYPRLNRSR